MEKIHSILKTEKLVVINNKYLIENDLWILTDYQIDRQFKSDGEYLYFGYFDINSINPTHSIKHILHTTKFIITGSCRFITDNISDIRNIMFQNNLYDEYFEIESNLMKGLLNV